MGQHTSHKGLSPIGKLLSHWMIEEELSRRGFAALIGCSDPFVSKVFKGDCEPPVSWVGKLTGEAKNAVLDHLIAKYENKIEELRGFDNRD